MPRRGVPLWLGVKGCRGHVCPCVHCTPTVAADPRGVHGTHNHPHDTLHNWPTEMGYHNHREQHIPGLDDTDDHGQPRQTIMDIVTTINDRQYLIDISVTDAVSNCPTRTTAVAVDAAGRRRVGACSSNVCAPASFQPATGTGERP